MAESLGEMEGLDYGFIVGSEKGGRRHRGKMKRTASTTDAL